MRSSVNNSTWLSWEAEGPAVRQRSRQAVKELHARCAVKVNGVAGLACEMIVEGDIVVEPVNEKKVQRDIVAY